MDGPRRSVIVNSRFQEHYFGLRRPPCPRGLVLVVRSSPSHGIWTAGTEVPRQTPNHRHSGCAAARGSVSKNVNMIVIISKSIFPSKHQEIVSTVRFCH